MSTMLARRDYRPFAEFIDWLETPWAAIRPIASHPMRVEDYVEDGH